jgi:3-oxoacyl-[acyl-carrier protein] reductase
MTLQSKNVLITGAYGGLGKSLSIAYLTAGHNLILVGRTKQKLDKLSNNLEKHNKLKKSITTYDCDFTNSDSVLSTIDKIKSSHQVDILINCAGVFPVMSIKDMSIQEYQECMMVNVETPFILIKELSDSMVKNKWGRIINIASSSAYGGAPLTSAYCASKHAILGLSRSLHKEFKNHGVRVICVSPGSIKTEMGKEVEKLGQKYDTFMSPKEVAEYICYTTSFDGHMISDEIRLNRMFVQ